MADESTLSARNDNENVNNDEESTEPTRTWPSEYISTASEEYQRMHALWQRFSKWIQAEAGEHLLLNSSPADVGRVFEVQEEFANGDSTFAFSADLLASLACHNGQDWSSSTGIFGRWYLLDIDSMYREWRDQSEMMEMGLYTSKKYQAMTKAQPRNSRIDTSYWFNPRWLPIACSRGENLGGDLICIDYAPLLSRDQGQVIIYFTESAERIVLADSLEKWMEACINDLEAGVYRFDQNRKTYVAGKERNSSSSSSGSGATEQKEEKSNGSSSAASSSSSSASSSSSSSSSLPTSAHPTIGVEAFMYSSIAPPEQRAFFIQNQTEALVYLGENDFNLLAIDGLTGNGGFGSDMNKTTFG